MLRLVGDTGRPLFSLNRKNVDYGLISLGVKTVEYIEIINDGDDAGVFSITPSFTDILTITPPKGRVNKHSSLKLLIEVTSEKPGRFDIPIKVTICGSNQFSSTFLVMLKFRKLKLVVIRLILGKCSLEQSLQSRCQSQMSESFQRLSILTCLTFRCSTSSTQQTQSLRFSK